MTLSKVATLLCLGLAALMAACGTTQPLAPAANSGTAADTPKMGGVLNTVGEDFTDFDLVYQGKTIENARDHGLVYERLLAFKKGPGVDFVSQILEPQLAERWEVSADARTFTYYLRKGVKYANIAPVNGRELTSADVKWSLEYYSRSGEFADKKYPVSQMAAQYEGLDGIDTPDSYTVRVRFKEPFAPFLNYSASQWMPIVAKETFRADMNPPRINTLVGTGPYIYDLAETQKDSRFVFSKNPTYWGGPNKPYLEKIRRLIIPDTSTQAAAFQTKQIDILTTPDMTAADEIRKNNPQAGTVDALDTLQLGLMTSQKRGGPLTDIRVRRAVSLALDRDEFNKLSLGRGIWALTGSFPGLFTDAETRAMLRTDVNEAKRLLAEAGYPNGVTFEFLPSNAVPDARNVLAQSQLKRAGIEVNFMNLPREQNRAKLYAGDFDFFGLNGGSGALGDADFDAQQFSYYSTSLQNWSKINDPELDKLLLAQRREIAPEKRRDAQRAVVRRINDQAWNPGWMFAPKTTFWQPYVKNFALHFALGQTDAFAWLDK